MSSCTSSANPLNGTSLRNFGTVNVVSKVSFSNLGAISGITVVFVP